MGTVLYFDGFHSRPKIPAWQRVKGVKGVVGSGHSHGNTGGNGGSPEGLRGVQHFILQGLLARLTGLIRLRTHWAVGSPCSLVGLAAAARVITVS